MQQGYFSRFQHVLFQIYLDVAHGRGYFLDTDSFSGQVFDFYFALNLHHHP
jgi:hypothetical protein